MKLRVALATALPLLLAAACGSSLIVKKTSTAGLKTVHVTLSAGGCNPTALAATAGPSNFVVSNQSSASVSEFEIHQGTDILAEAEFVTPGLAKSFAITLQPGHYTTLCTGGTRNGGKGTLTVTGHIAKATGGPSAEASARAVATYRRYVESQAALLVTRTTALVRAVQAGNVAQAKTLYTPARVGYERIEPVARSLADLNPRIDARITDVPAGHWGGFHRLERALFEEGDVSAMGPTAEQLLADVTTLAQRVRTVPMQPSTIANGAVVLLDQVSTTLLTGQEELYSHTDLADAAAEADGARAAFDAVAPLLPKRSTISVNATDVRFDAFTHALEPLRRGSGYIAPDQMTPKQTRTLALAVDAAVESISRVGAAIVG